MKHLRKFQKILKMSTGDCHESSSIKPVTCVLVGAGSRGHCYASYALYYPDKFKIVAVAEPRDFQRNQEKEEHKLDDAFCFKDWHDIVSKEKFADCVMICTVDRDHKEPAVAFAKKGYHILLEKPMSVTASDCHEIVRTCKDNNIILTVCHTLRYSTWSKRIKEIIDSGAIGDVVHIQHTEPVGYWHFAHSFVRGNWRNEALNCNSLLAKCCHDVDLIKYWMGSKRCVSVSSFGSLAHFKMEDKPPGSGSRCLDCPTEIELKCPYSAKRLYLQRGFTGWPVSVLTEVPDIESITEALKTGPYGRCVYECDNDVMTHQVTNFQFEGGATASLTMVAFTKRLCEREVKVYGTKGEITCDARAFATINVFDFVTEQTTTEELVVKSSGRLSGHGGSDALLMDAFVKAVFENRTDLILTGADDTLGSHLLVFAAEKARKENQVIKINPDGSF